MKLDGMCAVITGAAMGIGLATVKRLLAEGCTVTIWDRNEGALKDASVALHAPAGRLFSHACDVTDRARVQELAVTARTEMGKVDILINNAGYVSGGNFLDRPLEDWERTMSVNVTALFYTIYEFLPAMFERNCGHVVNISSAAGTIGVPGLAAYAASKWAVWGLTESLRFEAVNLNKFNVKFSSIHPSYLATGMFEGAKLGFPGNLLVPVVKNHDVIAKAIVESALKRGRYSPKRPWTVGLAVRMRGFLPDSWFQYTLTFLGIPKGMSTFRGRGK
ncbi:MAG: SDR family NAD(P)-dependent oxidoreductase [Ignavibacteriales bacterium]|nr:SDR family NAD(P)-dependent oxidoreductase [Ignavibacteriales bacterium]